MYSFIIEERTKKNLAVTEDYMKLLEKACSATGQEVELVKMGEPAKSKESYIVTDATVHAFKYLLKGYKKHIIWIQGIGPEESYMRNSSKLRFNVLSFVEKIMLKKAKMLMLVSEEMLRHYKRKYNLDLTDKSVIMPCFNEKKIEEDAFIDEKYSQNNFVYVGSIQKWQCFDEIAQMYASIEKKSELPVKFYVYTFQKEEARKIVDELGIKNFEIDCVDKEELSKCIKGMKYGFVLREDCAVNNVATPTKLSNYLANGIIPIFSGALKSFSEFNAQANVGIECNISDMDAGVEKILVDMSKTVSADEVRNKCIAAFDTYYNENKYLDLMVDKLKKVAIN